MIIPIFLIVTDQNCCSQPFDFTATFPLSTQEAATLSTALHLFPNPAANYFQLRAVEQPLPAGRLICFSSTGQRQLETQLPALQAGESWNIQLDDWPAGVYHVRLHTEVGTFWSKVVVSK